MEKQIIETKTANHTPGPWSVTKWETGKSIQVCTPHDGFGTGPRFLILPELSENCFVNGHTLEEYEANARLIAAAPELLEALKESLSYIENDRPGCLLIEDIKAVIAKAEGNA